MNSKRNFRMVRNLGLVVGALILSAGLASAQDVAAGKFTLPCEARWGGVELAPGPYWFTVSSASRGSMLTLRDENTGHGVGIFMSQGHADRTPSDKGNLILVRNGGKAFVRALELKGLGQTFYYAVPKDNDTILGQAPQPIRSVQVAISGK
jgi:hypothetical protein